MNIGERIKQVAYSKGYNQKMLADMKKVTPQAISHDFRAKKLGMNSIYEYARLLEVEPDFLLNNEQKESKQESKNEFTFGVDLVKENLRLSKEVSFLWRLVATNGIKVDASQLNFNLGVSYSAFAV